MRRVHVVAASFAVGMCCFGLGREAAARGPLIDQGVPPSSGGGGGGGLAIGDAITGGTATRLLYEGAGPVLADNAAFTVNDNSSLRQLVVRGDAAPNTSNAQIRIENPNTSNGSVTSDFVSVNYRSDYLLARMYGATSGTDELGLFLGHQGRFQCSTDSDCVVVAQGGSLRLANANRIGTSGTIGITINGQGVQLPAYNIEQIAGTPTHFNKGSCALNGGSPSQCSASVTGSTLGGSLACVCSIVGTSHKASCQVSVAGGTLTVTSDNGFTDTVNYLCW